MIEFRINLLRGRVPPPAARRARYWGMVAYLGAAGILLAFVLGLSVTRWLEGRAYEQRSATLEARFRASHPAADNIRSHARNLRRQLDAQRSALDEIDRAMAAEIRLARIIHALVFALPRGAALRQFSLDARDRAVSFEIVIMGGPAAQVSGPADLMERWSAHEDLASRIRQIQFVGSQVESSMARDDKVWRFSGALPGEEG